MSTLQIVAIAVAGAVVLLLIVALVVSRRRRADDAAARQEGSFLDAAPTDTLAGLGKAVAPIEMAPLEDAAAPTDPATITREASAASNAPDAAASGEARHETPGGQASAEPAPESLWPPASPPSSGQPAAKTGLVLDWGGPSSNASTPSAAPVPVPATPATDTPATERATAAPPTPSPSPSPADAAAAPERPATPAPAAEAQPDRPPAAGAPDAGRKVPLSDILVTTSHKIVDLDDPEVRHMLTDLVKYEIEQASLFREQGHDVDAVLQLTEAERVTAALGMEETTQRIREMLSDIQD